MSSINFQKTYALGEKYDSIRERANRRLDKYPRYRNLITFHDSNNHVTFSTERLIPESPSDRPRVMLLFSNPHLYSVDQGMFLSPNTRGRENPFWSVMENAGWLPIAKENRTPKQLAEICSKGEYAGPFDFIFYCYYAFPTDFPEDVRWIFGSDFFSEYIEPEAEEEFMKTLQETSAEAVLTFNKGIFNLVSNDPIEHYVERLIEGDLIQSQIKGMDRHIPIYLTFPTGWRYRKHYMEIRKASLETIRTAISNVSNMRENKNS